jgi:putative DNA primase/helicase
VREQSLVFLWGDGGNGKGTFLNTFAAIMGDYAIKAPMETFMARKFDAHPTELAGLHGARLVYASENEEGRSWAQAKLQELTGGDPIRARFMNKNFFTYDPTFKLTFMGNLQPTLQTTDNAMKRRMCMVPFDKRPAIVDTELFEKLKPEWPGILRWAINGCVDWLEHGLPRPPVVIGANEDYFAEQDLIAQWLADECRCEPSNQHIWEKTSDLFAAWCAFAKAAREPAGTVRGFSFKLQRLGFVKLRNMTERRMIGVELVRRPDGRQADRTPFD